MGGGADLDLGRVVGPAEYKLVAYLVWRVGGLVSGGGGGGWGESGRTGRGRAAGGMLGRERKEEEGRGRKRKEGGRRTEAIAERTKSMSG